MTDLGNPFDIIKMASEAIKSFANAMASAASDLRKLMAESRGILSDSRETREAKKYRLALKELRGAYVVAPVGFFGHLQDFALQIRTGRQFPIPFCGGLHDDVTQREATEFAWGQICEELGYFADRLDRAIGKLDPAVSISDDIPVDRWIALQIYLKKKASAIRRISQTALPDDLNEFGNVLLNLCAEMDGWAKSRVQLVNSILTTESKREIAGGYDGKYYVSGYYMNKYLEIEDPALNSGKE